MKIWEQAKMDIYLVDFEKPNRETKQVNAWRYMFIANEFAELQTEMRYFNPETMIFWFVFFWVGLGWKHMSETDPSFSSTKNDIQMENVMLKFFLSSFILWCITSVQWVLHELHNFTKGSMLNQFKDLCTLANISIIMLDEHVHGYYLTAKAPWGSSDIPLDWLQ